MNLSQAALDALRCSVADDQKVCIPVITDREVYREVDRALSRITGGGRWDIRQRAYLYRWNPRPALAELVGAAPLGMPSPTRDLEMSYWATPPDLAKRLVDGLDLVPGTRVLEPSAGCGALVQAIRVALPQVHVTAVEPDPGRLAVLRAAPATPWVMVLSGTLEDHAPEWVRAFDAVVMNPPFTLPGRRYAWAEHVVTVWELLRPGGRLKAIVPTSLDYGRQRPIAAARALLTSAGAVWHPAGAGAFLGAGTGVHTLVVEATR